MKTPVLESVFNIVAGFQSCENCETFKNTYFDEHLRMTASGYFYCIERVINIV